MSTVTEKAEALYRSLVGCKDDAEKMYEMMKLAGCDRGLLSEQQSRIETAKMALANFEPLINPGLASQGAKAGDGGDPARATWTKIGQSDDQASVPAVPAGLVLSKGETEVFAARLRRLCSFVGYESPSYQDDILVSVGPTVIGECLRLLATRKLRCGDVRAQLEGIHASLTDVSEFSVENARKQIQAMLEQITERVDLV